METNELLQISPIEYKIEVFKGETQRDYSPIGFPTEFVHDFINWMSERKLTTLYSTEYIDWKTKDRKFEMGNRVVTRVSEDNGFLYEYDAKHVDSVDYKFDGIEYEQMMEKLQHLEDLHGKTTFGVKFQIMKKLGLNAYQNRQEKSMPAGFQIKN